MQRQPLAIEVVQGISADAQTSLQQQRPALPAANLGMQISAAASRQSIATSWWQMRRRNHAENGNRMTETAANAEGQHAKELESTAASAAASTEQPEVAARQQQQQAKRSHAQFFLRRSRVRGEELSLWCYCASVPRIAEMYI